MELNIEKSIQEQLEQIDIREIVVEEIRERAHQAAFPEIQRLVKAEAQRLVVEGIQRVIAEPMEVCDGYCDPVYYESFESFFKKALKENMHSRSAQEVIERAIREQVRKLLEERYGSVVKQIVDALTAKKA